MSPLSLPVPPCSPILAQLAPDLAARIAAIWDDVTSTTRLLEDLLIHHSTTLPPRVTGELLRVFEYHARCRINDAPDTSWELPVSRLPASPRPATSA